MRFVSSSRIPTHIARSQSNLNNFLIDNHFVFLNRFSNWAAILETFWSRSYHNFKWRSAPCSATCKPASCAPILQANHSSGPDLHIIDKLLASRGEVEFEPSRYGCRVQVRVAKNDKSEDGKEDESVNNMRTPNALKTAESTTTKNSAAKKNVRACVCVLCLLSFSMCEMFYCVKNVWRDFYTRMLF